MKDEIKTNSVSFMDIGCLNIYITGSIFMEKQNLR